MRILAVDPGPTPGFAAYDTETEAFSAWTAASWEDGCGQITRVDADSRTAWDVIICEDFFISGARAKDSNVTIEMIGVARWFAYEWEIPFVLQAPADAKAFSTNEKLKMMGWYTIGDHARSATRHLLMYCARANLVDLRRLLT